jgi:hypothetical protein
MQAEMEDVPQVEVEVVVFKVAVVEMEETAVGVSAFSLKYTAYEILRHT